MSLDPATDRLEGGSAVRTAVESVARGQMAVVAGDGAQPGVAFLVMGATAASEESVARFLEWTSGLLAVALTAQRVRWLLLDAAPGVAVSPGHPDDTERPSPHSGPLVTVDYQVGTTTGISAADRARTIAALADGSIRPSDLRRPGHVIPVEETPGGLQAHAGAVEAAIALCVMAGTVPVALMSELVAADGELLAGDALTEFTANRQIPVVSVDSVARRQFQLTRAVTRSGEADLATDHGFFRAVAYRERDGGAEHLALVRGDVAAGGETLVRVQRECLAGDIIDAGGCDCGPLRDAALARITAAPRGVLVYLRGRDGLGLGLQPADRHRREVPAPLSPVAEQILDDLGVARARLLIDGPSAGGAATSSSGAATSAGKVVGVEPLILG